MPPASSAVTPLRNKVAVAMLGLFLAAYLGGKLMAAMGPSFSEGYNDFLAFYTGGKLAGSGQLYDPEANYRVHRQARGVRMPAILYIRLPFYALLLRPFSWLDYHAAWMAFFCLNLCAAVWFLWRFLWGDHLAFLLGVSCLPLYAALVNGQDVALVLAISGWAFLLLQRGADFRSGLLFSLCAIKPHLFVLVPLALAAHRKWRVLAGGAAGGVVLLLLSFLAGGRNWLQGFLSAIRNPMVHPSTDVMPNLASLSHSLSAPGWLVWVLMLLAAAKSAGVALRAGRIEAGLAGALAGALLLGPHVYIADTVLLLLAFALVRSLRLPKAALLPWALIISPLPISLTALRGPWTAAAPLLLLLALAALAIWCARHSRDGAPDEAHPGGARDPSRASQAQ